jgi:uncharacterized membrane protein YagU involved in acid resistance
MKIKKYIEKILEVNNTVFPFFVGISYFLLLVESFTYEGFLRGFILIDARIFMFITIVSGLLSFYISILTNEKQISRLKEMVLDANALVFPILLIFYWIITISENTHYSNYVFSTIHIQPDNFFYVVVFSLLIALIRILDTKRGDVYQIIKGGFGIIRKYSWFLLLILVLSLFTLENLPRVLSTTFKTNIYMFTHLKDNYGDKMRITWGSYYDYMVFIRDNTPPDALIVTPPQEGPWLTTGNAGLDRYFLYPRTVINGKFDSLPEGKDYDYVMLVWGEWLVEDKARYGWPKVPVKAEKVMYFNATTNSMMEVPGNYDPNNETNKMVNGLIKVKK